MGLKKLLILGLVLLPLSLVSGADSGIKELAVGSTSWTIVGTFDDGILQGHYVLLAPDGEGGKDGKVKNIRPSEELATDFLNLCIEIVSYRDTKLPKL